MSAHLAISDTDATFPSLQVPSVWGPVSKTEDPYAPQTGGGCCNLQ